MACREAEVRRRWGCDAPAKPSAYAIPCFECFADAAHVGNCWVCRKTGQVELDRCPTALLSTPAGEDAEACVEAYLRYVDGHRPAAGGMVDQTHAFDVAVRYIGPLWARHRLHEEQVASHRAASAAKP